MLRPNETLDRSREALQFNLDADVTIDVVHFLALAQTPDTQPGWASNLEQALAIYRGPFLEGFHADDCQEFEQWITAGRSELEQLAASTLFRLAQHDHAQGNVARALQRYRHCLTLNPYDEAARRGLMLALVDSDQRGAALAHFEAYRRELQQELGAEPEAQTTELVAVIRQGYLVTGPSDKPTDETAPPITAWSDQETAETPPFVGRIQELAVLHAGARRAALGRGGVTLVTGEAGSGKTYLLHELARQLGHAARPWAITFGNCTALLGIGDLYQPFVDGLRLFVQHKYSLPNNHVLLPNQLEPPPSIEVMRLFREQAPDWAHRVLVGAGTGAAPQAANGQALPPLPQAALFDQLARFFEQVTHWRPLLLVLDNLHWADAGTVALLFHLAQALAHSRTLIVGAFRPGALARAQAERSHSLSLVIQQLRHQLGASMIDLDQADGRGFVEALLDREPNRLQASFRETLYHHTEGHALFTVELLHTLVTAGWLTQDSEGRWGDRGVLNWHALPPRVEALIRERIDCLRPADRSLLNAACVQGNEFRSQIVAALTGEDEVAVSARLSGELATDHRVAVPGPILPNAGTPAAIYHFRHHLFQAFLYNSLDEVQRRHLHRATGLEMERLFAAHGADAGVTLQALAWHYERGGEPAKALKYLRIASEQALAWHSYAEAVGYLTKALVLAPPAQPEQRFELLAAREQVHAQLREPDAQAADVSAMEQLAGQIQNPRLSLVALLRRANLAEQTAHYAEAIAAANTALALAVAQHDLPAQIEAQEITGRAHWWRGEMGLARRYYVSALRKARALPLLQAVPRDLVHLGVACWSLDDLAGADAAFNEALACTAGSGLPLVQAASLMGRGMVACARGDYGQAEGKFETALSTTRPLHDPWLEGQVMLNQLALYRLTKRCDHFLTIYDHLMRHCQTINDRWTATAGQVEAATLFVQVGAWARAERLIETATAAASALSASLLKARLLLLAARIHLEHEEPAYAAAAEQALPIAAHLGIARILAEVRLLSGLTHQQRGDWAEAAEALQQARAEAQGEGAQRLLPEIVAAQAQLALEKGEIGEALARVGELLAGSPTLLIDQAADPGSLYFVCFRVLNAAGEPWAEQMLVRGCGWLREQAALIADDDLRRSFCEDIPRHRELRALGAALTSTPGPFA